MISVFRLSDFQISGSAISSRKNNHQARARQNVIFELGYFIGKMGRKSGRVILLSKGNLDIPSDLSGILRIDIGQGIRTAGEDIRKAVKIALEAI